MLTYAEQRALEIGITIAGGADVILLDEPTAGMSHAETERAVALIRRVSEGRTLMMVEHDMSVVFDLADRISVLVYGQVIASDVPARITPGPRGAEGLSRRSRGMMLEVARSARLLRQEPYPAGRLTSRRRRRDRQHSRPQRRRPLDHVQGDHGRRAAAGLDHVQGRGHRRPQAVSRSRIGASATCRRTAPSFRRLTVRQNLMLGIKAGSKARALGLRRHLRLFPRLGSAPNAGRRAVGRRAADADDLPHADGRSRSHHDRRADRGPGAANGRAGRRPAAEIARRGVSILLVEQKLTIAMRISHRVYVMGHGRIVFEGTPSELAANTAVRRTWLEV